MICDKCKMKGGKLKASTVKKLLKNSYSGNQEHEIDGFIRDDSLSGNRAQVYYNPETGEAHVIHRGSKGMKDRFVNNPAYAFNNYESTDRYKCSDKSTVLLVVQITDEQYFPIGTFPIGK